MKYPWSIFLRDVIALQAWKLPEDIPLEILIHKKKDALMYSTHTEREQFIKEMKPVVEGMILFFAISLVCIFFFLYAFFVFNVLYMAGGGVSAFLSCLISKAYEKKHTIF